MSIFSFLSEFEPRPFNQLSYPTLVNGTILKQLPQQFSVTKQHSINISKPKAFFTKQKEERKSAPNLRRIRLFIGSRTNNSGNRRSLVRIVKSVSVTITES
jgi:hypothetical protein